MPGKVVIFSPKVLVQYFLLTFVAPMLPLLISRRWGWWEAWAFAAICILGFFISRGLAAQRHPDLIAERARLLDHADAKPWDRILALLAGLGTTLIGLAAGLDALFGWSDGFSLPVEILGMAVFLGGYVFGTSALMENRFFSAVVRLQGDRGQVVVSSGPYRWVRHPGYAGALCSYLTIPLFLDSPWAFLPAVFIALSLVLRTSLEDQTLQAELPGYREYTKQVRYRLLPGIW
jgi:protein-S-isoprenylcysteine O-methyltransferase Ste14